MDLHANMNCIEVWSRVLFFETPGHQFELGKKCQSINKMTDRRRVASTFPVYKMST